MQSKAGCCSSGDYDQTTIKKEQADSTVDSSSQEKVKANPKAKADEQNRTNNEFSTKKSTELQAITNQVANIKSKIK